MTDPQPVDDGNADLDFEEGRYLYCAVYADDDATISAEGLDGESVSLLVADGVGVVVQPVDSVFDSEDLTQVREWLLTHQGVVDDAGEAFGTPLPFRFDTILRGDDEIVFEWLAGHRAEIEDALSWLAGRWEYRIEVRWDEAAVTESVRDTEDLQALADRVEDASEGTGFLLESQYETRLTELLAERRREVEADLAERLEPHAVEIQMTGEGPGVFSGGADDGFETVTQFSVLAEREAEGAIGDQLEPIADRPNYDVRYTGPWPPYSFAPEIGGEQ
ncbi:gas vesicle protein GvpL [Halobacterium wangiae]|uniref:gas vesicle protein GvpL n=1 Tax=Halobacterium wangiae TaxID=2902623 RepID=UPI001E5110C3|nr:GvpL/GvpF family gas vesicle protein [Halobacterium wangiae]